MRINSPGFLFEQKVTWIATAKNKETGEVALGWKFDPKFSSAKKDFVWYNGIETLTLIWDDDWIVVQVEEIE